MEKNLFANSKGKYWFFCCIIFSIVYFCYTYPTFIEFSSKIVGKNDAFGIFWNTYIFETGLHSGKIWTTQQSFYPWGTSLIYHASTPFIGILTAPFKNKLLIINIFLFSMFVFSGLGGYLLAKKFISNNYFAIICGFVFAFSPYKMARIEEHYPLILTAIIPFFFIVFMNAFSFESITVLPKITSKKNFYLLFPLFIIGIIFDYVITFQMLYLCFLFLLFYYVFSFFNSASKKVFWTVILALLAGMHLIIGWLVQHGIDDKGALWWTGKWTDFIVPYNARIYPHWGAKLISFFNIQSQYIESDMFIGYSLLLAFVISIFYFYRLKNVQTKSKALLFMLMMFALIVMPVIRLPFSFTFYPPTALLHFLPIIKNLRCPTRFINDIMLLMPIFIFYVLEQLSIKTYVKHILASALFLSLFIEYYPARYSYISYQAIPKIYSELAKRPGESVLVYPLGLRDGMKLEGRFDIETMQYQTVYKKKTMGGYISRMEDWMWYVHYQNALTNTLLQLEKDSLYSIPKVDYLSALKKLKLDFVVIPKRYQNEKAAIFLQTTIKPQTILKEDIEGDLLLTLKR